VDNDGFITREEMYNIVDAIYQMVVSSWQMVDALVYIFIRLGSTTVRGRKHATETGG